MLALLASRELTQMQEMARAIAEYGRHYHERLDASPLAALMGFQYGGVLVFELALALGIVVVGFTLRWLLIWGLGSLLHKHWGRRESEWQESIYILLLRFLSALIVMLALFFACSMITLPSAPIDWSVAVWRIYLSIALIWFAMLTARSAEYGTRLLIRRKSGDAGLGNRQVLPILRDVAKVSAFVLVTLLIVQTWGYNATALLAGVGLGGLAIAFAAQDTIANLFGTMVIYSDSPFKVGDHVIIAGIEGTVEEIGVRSTRIRMFDRTVVSVPNKSVANENVFNLGLMNHRRIRVDLGLTYDTTPEQLEAALQAIRLILSTQSGIVPGQYWAHLFSFNTYSQDLRVQCFTESPEYEDFLELQEDLLLRIKRKLDSMGLKLAYPTQVVHYRGQEPPLPPLAVKLPPGNMPEA